MDAKFEELNYCLLCCKYDVEVEDIKFKFYIR